MKENAPRLYLSVITIAEGEGVELLKKRIPSDIARLMLNRAAAEKQ
jgi:hypothetical protein